MSVDADLAVVGGGIIGLTTATLALLRRPGLEVVVADASRVGAGTTRSSCALDAPFARTERQRALVAAARRASKEIGAAVEGFEPAQLPLVWVAPTDAANRLSSALGGVEVVRADDGVWDQVQACYGPIDRRGDDVFTAAVTGRVWDVSRACHSLRGWIESSGGSIRENCAVQALVPTESGWQLEFAPGATPLNVEEVVTARGPALVSSPLGFASVTPMRTKKVSALTLALDVPAGVPAVMFFDDDAFLLPRVHCGDVAFSYRCATWDVEPGSELSLDDDESAAAIAHLAARAPGLVDSVSGALVSADAYTGDRTPVVERVADGLVVAGGASGSGFRYAPGMAHETLEALAASKAMAGKGES